MTPSLMTQYQVFDQLDSDRSQIKEALLLVEIVASTRYRKSHAHVSSNMHTHNYIDLLSWGDRTMAILTLPTSFDQNVIQIVFSIVQKT